MKTLFLSIIFSIISLSVIAQINLFNGKTLHGWMQMGGKAIYRVEGDAIVGVSVPNTPNSFLVTEKNYGDFILELEVMIEDSSSNSGIQFRSQYDPAGNNGAGKVFGYQYELDPSSRRWTAGIYDEGRREWLYPLSLNPTAQDKLLTGVYNKVKIECLGKEIRTWINGKAAAYVYDDVDASGFIALQVHSIGKETEAGKRIYWKNISLTPIKSFSTTFPLHIFPVNTIANSISPQQQRAGWKLLFDGKTTTGWKGAYQKGFPEKGWSVSNGELKVHSSDGGESVNGGDIVTVKKYSAFDLSFEFKLTPGANSGLKYFVTLTENNKGSAIGLEYQLLDDTLHPDAKMGKDGNRTLASLYDLIKADKQKRHIRQPGNWNSGRIVVYPDSTVEHYLNGVKVLEYKRGSAAFRELVADSKYKDWKNFGEAAAGHLLLQDHGNEVFFRSIRIREFSK